MKFTNTTDFADHFLRRMTVWIARELRVPTTTRGKVFPRLRQIRFTKYRQYWRGRAWSSGRVLVRIGPNEGYPGRVHAPTYTIADNIEALVKVTAHEIAHLANWQECSKTREARIDGIALGVLYKFRSMREDLLAQWGEAPKERAKKPRLTLQQRNEAKARAKLAEWEKKLRTAKTKVAKYKRSVTRYDKIAANHV